MSLAVIDGRRVGFDLTGQDTDNVLICGHGLMMDRSLFRNQIEEARANKWQVITLDFRGHGASDIGLEPFGILDLARDVVAIADHLSISRFHYIGISLGGVVGQALGYAFKDRIKSLVLVASPWEAMLDPNENWRATVAEAREHGFRRFAENAIERWISLSFRARNPALAAELIGTASAMSVEGFAANMAALRTFEHRDHLSKVEAPVLIVVGEQDVGISIQSQQQLCEKLAWGELHVVANARHFPHLEQKEIFSGILANWIKTCE